MRQRPPHPGREREEGGDGQAARGDNAQDAPREERCDLGLLICKAPRQARIIVWFRIMSPRYGRPEGTVGWVSVSGKRKQKAGGQKRKRKLCT